MAFPKQGAIKKIIKACQAASKSLTPYQIVTEMVARISAPATYLCPETET